MIDRSQLSDNAWAQIQTLLSTTKGARLLKAPSCRRFVEAVLWILRTGAQWRMLPSRFGAIHAHACAAGAAHSLAFEEALGRSLGGFSCKIHALTDALGLPIRFILTGGQAADITQAVPLLEGISTSALLADKGYDANQLLAWLEARRFRR